MIENIVKLILHYGFLIIFMWLLTFLWEAIGFEITQLGIYYGVAIVTTTLINKHVRKNWVELLLTPRKLLKLPTVPKRNPKEQDKLKGNPLND